MPWYHQQNLDRYYHVHVSISVCFKMTFQDVSNSQGGLVCMNDMHRNSKTSQRIKDSGRSIKTGPINSLHMYIHNKPTFHHTNIKLTCSTSFEHFNLTVPSGASYSAYCCKIYENPIALDHAIMNLPHSFPILLDANHAKMIDPWVTYSMLLWYMVLIHCCIWKIVWGMAVVLPVWPCVTTFQGQCHCRKLG